MQQSRAPSQIVLALEDSRFTRAPIKLHPLALQPTAALPADSAATPAMAYMEGRGPDAAGADRAYSPG